MSRISPFRLEAGIFEKILAPRVEYGQEMMEFSNMVRSGFASLLVLLGLVLLGNNSSVNHVAGTSDTLRYFFVGHAYNWQPGYSRIDPRVVGLDYSRFDKQVFGGDLNSEALKYERFVTFIDSAFDLRDINTMWVMGNHEARNENFEWYEKYTGRHTWNAHSSNGAVFINMNTTLNAGNCEELDAQFEMIRNICDTITSATSHLFVFCHHSVWNNVPGLPGPWTYANWQIPFWDANCSGDSVTYVAAVYPLLLQAKQKGVEVISVMGDAGAVNKGNYMYSSDSLLYIASGINNSKYVHDSVLLASQPKDKVVIFEHVPSERKVHWKFHDLDSLFAAHQ